MNVIVAEYDPRWVEKYEEEAARLRTIFKGNLIEIHHIGSTSVPGLLSKPVIDILPIVRDIAAVDELNVSMIELGYEPMGEFGIVGRRYFRKGGENRTHHVHAFQHDNAEPIERHLAFRDYLRAHPEVAQQYGELKAELARLHPRDIESYMDGKDAFIKRIEGIALEWSTASGKMYLQVIRRQASHEH